MTRGARETIIGGARERDRRKDRDRKERRQEMQDIVDPWTRKGAALLTDLFRLASEQLLGTEKKD